MGVLSQPRPDRLEGEQARRPQAEQPGVIVAVLSFGEADATARRWFGSAAACR
jgi:hypothetical protein